MYLLSQVGENELLQLAKNKDTKDETEQQDILKTLISKKEESLKEETTEDEGSIEQPKKEEKQKEKSSILSVFPILLVMLVVSGIAYYFKIYKPKHNRKDTDYEEEFEFIDDAEIEKEVDYIDDDFEFEDDDDY